MTPSSSLLALFLLASPERPDQCPFAIAYELQARLERCRTAEKEHHDRCMTRVKRTARNWDCEVPDRKENRKWKSPSPTVP